MKERSTGVAEYRMIEIVYYSCVDVCLVSQFRARLPIDGRLATRDTADRQRKLVR